MTPHVKAKPLTEAELNWCNRMRQASLALCDAYTGARPATRPSINDIHDAYEGWLTATMPRGLLKRAPKHQPDANTVVMALGVALGDQIAEATGMEWKIITDAYGTDMGLFLDGVEGAYSEIVTHPMNFIAKRIVERQSGWLAPSATQLIKEIRNMTNGRPP